MSEQRNLILAVIMSVAILTGFHYLYEVPRAERIHQIEAQQKAEDAGHQVSGRADSPAAEISTLTEEPVKARSDVLATASRVVLSNPRLSGTIDLTGSRFDDLTFTDYYTAIDHKTHVDLLSPSDTESPYFASVGWLASTAGVAVPDDKTVWQVDGGKQTLSPDHPVTLTWQNGNGLVFRRTISLDANYMFTVQDSVTNKGTAKVSLVPYASITRQGDFASSIHPANKIIDNGLESALGLFNGSLDIIGYKKLQEDKLALDESVKNSTGGWLAFSDKYWLVAAIPQQDEPITAEFRHSKSGKLDVFQTDYKGAAKDIAPGTTLNETTRLFAGAKQVQLLTAYRDDLNIPKLDLAIDWGRFRFLTKPFFYAIDYLAKSIGNFGLGILAFTICIRILILPLGWKMIRTGNKMKELTPQMTAIKERHLGDKAALQKDLMELYQKEKVNPLSGCLPIFIQFPIFLSLYKVLSTTIEMRQQPFFWYVHDLSAQDPTNLFTLFGLLPVISFLPHLGFLPLVLGLTLFLLQISGPQPADPLHAKMMLINPVIFTFMLGRAPVGLVIYYILSNTISIIQQRAIHRFYKWKYKPT